MTDWADEKAREWLAKTDTNATERDEAELAALLRELRIEPDRHRALWAEHKSHLLAEVRRVIAEEGSKFAPDVLQRILSRLEKLDVS